VVFDLDGVLYPAGNGFLQSVRDNSRDFILTRLGAGSAEEAERIRKEAFSAANQTAAGLVRMGYEFDIKEFGAFCRRDEDRYLRPDARVREALVELQATGHRLVVHTNTNEAAAARALAALQLDDGLFSAVYGSDHMREVCKPEHEAWLRVLSAEGAEAAGTYFLDDSLRNALAAKQVGLTSVFVADVNTSEQRLSKAREGTDGVVMSVSREQLRGALPQLYL